MRFSNPSPKDREAGLISEHQDIPDVPTWVNEIFTTNKR